MHEILNDLFDNVFIDSKKAPKINNVFKSNKVFTCYVCGKLLKSKQNLKYHVKTHTNVMRMSVQYEKGYQQNIKKWFTTPKNYTL